MKHDETFRPRLREAMTDANLTIERMAELTGIPRRTIENWRSGKNAPQKFMQDIVLDTIAKIKRKGLR